MADDRPTVGYFGDLDDPWVASIADALPHLDQRRHRPGALPDEPPECDLAIVHRAILGPSDADRLAGWRSAGTRVILCVGPHVRARDLQRASDSADVVLTEATAAETVARHVVPSAPMAERGVLPLVAVVARGFETRRMLVEGCASAGYPARGSATWEEAAPSRLAVWEAPVLEPGWARGLEASAGRSVLAMIGFADRGLVAEARRAGAAACLEWPCDLADLEFVLTRLAELAPIAAENPPPHPVPPPPMGLRVVRAPMADRPPRR